MDTKLDRFLFLFKQDSLFSFEEASASEKSRWEVALVATKALSFKHVVLKEGIYSNPPLDHKCSNSVFIYDNVLVSTDTHEVEGDINDDLCTTLSNEDRDRIRERWALSLIVKVYGKKVGYRFLTQKLKSLWKIQAQPLVVDLGLDFFLLKFHSVEDLNWVINGGPWFWRAISSFSSVAIWVRLPELPVDYFDEGILKKIGSKIGLPLKIDANTLSGERDNQSYMKGLGPYAFTVEELGIRTIYARKKITPESPYVAAFRDVEDSYGPWMVVQSRKTKKVRSQSNGINVKETFQPNKGEFVEVNHRPLRAGNQNVDKALNLSEGVNPKLPSLRSNGVVNQPLSEQLQEPSVSVPERQPPPLNRSLSPTGSTNQPFVFQAQRPQQRQAHPGTGEGGPIRDIETSVGGSGAGDFQPSRDSGGNAIGRDPLPGKSLKRGSGSSSINPPHGRASARLRQVLVDARIRKSNAQGRSATQGNRSRMDGEKSSTMKAKNAQRPPTPINDDSSVELARVRNAQGILSRLPFDGVADADVIGYQGGIWLLWRSSRVSVQIVGSTEQEIHAVVKGC
ncbi:hypothetical protein COLO4_37787 [Corchorus olitorius]|uniref:DUF4283 domain-containing protein n=1 Tax=Corchorus olitorius TaxID=93759 RepID=A0A1R3FZ88_9ROSI|nr:hypothetical protein COLO4_37787 [Corchorus olitorius]